MQPIISRSAAIGNWLLYVATFVPWLTGCGPTPSAEDRAADRLAAAGAKLGEDNSGVVSLSWETPRITIEDALEIGRLEHLVELKLRVDQGDPLITPWQDLKQLRRVELRGPPFFEITLMGFSPDAPLEQLRLRGTNLMGKNLVHLAPFHTLVQIDVSETQVDDTSMETLVRLPKLEKLNLWRTKVGDEGLAALSAAPSLTWLNVDATAVTDTGLPHLAKLGKLKYLHLGSTAVSDAGVSDLAKLMQLEELIVTRTKLTDDGIARLKAALPKTKITHIYVPPRM